MRSILDSNVALAVLRVKTVSNHNHAPDVTKVDAGKKRQIGLW